jgi:hypothetical protein
VSQGLVKIVPVRTDLPGAALVAVADAIVKQELAYQDKRYGNKHQRGSEPRAYHNGSHGAGSVVAVERIIRRAVQSGRLMTWHVYLGRIAAAFHDHDPEDVVASADAAAAAMREHPEVFSNFHISLVRAGIISTRVRFHDGMVVQIVDLEDAFCCAVADADLAHLAMSTAIQSSLDFDEECQRLSGRSELNRKTTIKSLRSSEKLILNHQFKLPESREMFAAGQRENHRRLVELTDKYEGRQLTRKQLQQYAARAAKGSVLA